VGVITTLSAANAALTVETATTAKSAAEIDLNRAILISPGKSQ
jgi:hypothetical protein